VKLTYDPAISFPDIHPKEMTIYVHTKNLCPFKSECSSHDYSE
jgi:hypothetical protein